MVIFCVFNRSNLGFRCGQMEYCWNTLTAIRKLKRRSTQSIHYTIAPLYVMWMWPDMQLKVAANGSCHSIHHSQATKILVIHPSLQLFSEEPVALRFVCCMGNRTFCIFSKYHKLPTSNSPVLRVSFRFGMRLWRSQTVKLTVDFRHAPVEWNSGSRDLCMSVKFNHTCYVKLKFANS